MNKTPLKQTHIFVGQVKDRDVFYEAQETSQIVRWAVPATARIEEKGIFLLPRVLVGNQAAFVTVGVITSQPEKDDNRWTRWGADISIITFTPRFEPVALASVQTQFGEWDAIQGQSPWDRSFTILDFYFPFINLLKMGQSYSVASQFEQALR